MSDIFLSYASEDRERVRPLVERLEAHGWSVWWDPDIPKGTDFADTIEAAIDDSRTMVVVWSAASVSSRWVRGEAREGIENGRGLLPVRLDDSKPPIDFRGLQDTDLTDWGDSASHPELEALISALETILGVPTSTVGAGRGKDEAAPAVELEIDLEDLNGEGWVTLDGGTFTMGSEHGEDDEKPPHQVTLSPYLMSRYPVTNRQYVSFVMETGKEAPRHWAEAQVPEGGESHPVVNVSWWGAEAYCKWLTKRVGKGVVSLPTEAQWEFAAGGAEGREYPWGAEEPDKDRANFDNPARGTSPVDKYAAGATPTGIYDLAGNADEWCRDWYGPYSEDSITDPAGPDEGVKRVLRGGSLVVNSRFLRAAYRFDVYPGFRGDSLGFRVVWSAAGGQG